MRWVAAAIVDWSLVVLAFVAVYTIPYSAIFAWLLIGNRQHAIALLGHDGAHQLIVSHNRWWNDLLCNVFSFWPLAIPLERYREFHFAHHRNINNNLDPEIPLKLIGPCRMEGQFSKTRIATHAALDLIGFGTPQLLGFLWLVRARTLKECIPYCVCMSLCVLLIVLGYWFVVLLWFLSLYSVFWSCFRLRVWSEHVGLNEFETYILEPTLIQRLWYLPHNAEYHWAHHEWPNVAFSDLPNKFAEEKENHYESIR